MKVFFLGTAFGTLYLVFFKFKATYDSNHDTFRAEFLVIPAVGLALLVNHDFSTMEVGVGDFSASSWHTIRIIVMAAGKVTCQF